MRRYRKAVLAVAFLFACAGMCGAINEEGRKEARKYFDRGMAVVEMAKTDEDYRNAVEEFSRAIAIDLDWREARYNLAVVEDKAGLYQEALDNLKMLQGTASSEKEKEELQSFITKVEYKNEIYARNAAKSAAENVAIEPIGASVQQLRFYEGKTWDVPMEERTYSKFFARSSTRRVAGELGLEHSAQGERKYFDLEVVYIKPNGSVLGHLVHNTFVEGDWSSSYHTFDWGWDKAGQWPAGRYQVEVYYNNKRIAAEEFSIY